MRSKPAAFTAATNAERSPPPRPPIDGSPEPTTMRSPKSLPWETEPVVRRLVSNRWSQPTASAAVATLTSLATDAGTNSVCAFRSTRRSWRSSELTTMPQEARLTPGCCVAERISARSRTSGSVLEPGRLAAQPSKAKSKMQSAKRAAAARRRGACITSRRLSPSSHHPAPCPPLSPCPVHQNGWRRHRCPFARKTPSPACSPRR